MSAVSDIPADDVIAIGLTVCILGFVVAGGFTILGWLDKRRAAGVPDDAADAEKWAKQTLAPTRDWQQLHNSTGVGAVNPAYYSRMSPPPVGDDPILAWATSPVPASVQLVRHRRPPSEFAAWMAGFWLLLLAPIGWIRPAARPTLTGSPANTMRVVDPDEPPVRPPVDALINTAHVGAHVSDQVRAPGSDRLPKHAISADPTDAEVQLRDWLTRKTEAVERLKDDMGATQPMLRVLDAFQEPAEVKVSA